MDEIVHDDQMYSYTSQKPLEHNSCACTCHVNFSCAFICVIKYKLFYGFFVFNETHDTAVYCGEVHKRF